MANSVVYKDGHFQLLDSGDSTNISITQLSDVPDYTGNAGKFLKVKATEDGLEYDTPSGGVSDGDKGDITVSSSGTVWSIDSGLDAVKISSGVVSNTEFDYLNGVTSSIQTQLDDKLDTPTGTPDGTKYLRDDNTWQPVSGGSGLSQAQSLKLISFRI